MKKTALMLASLALAAGANAGSVEYSFDNPSQTTEINQTGSLNLFDPSMGMLTGISLTLSGSNSTVLTLSNTGSSIQTVSAESTTRLNFSSTLATLQAKLAAANPVLVLSESTGDVDIAPNDVFGSGELTDSDSVTWDTQLNNILSSFVGMGSFDIGCKSRSGLLVDGGGGNVHSDQQTQAQCGATIVYTFDTPNNDVPEPAMPALLGAAMAGLWVARRRKA